MKKQLILSLSLFSLLTVVLLNCQKKEDPAPSTPTTPTNPVTATAPTLDNAANATTSSDITATSAKVSSTLSANGGAAISQHGHVWSETNAAPTIADTKTELGAASGPFPLKFTSELKSLKANTNYNVRAYAVNDKGTVYGAAVQVKTGIAATVSTYKTVSWEVHSGTFPKGGLSDPALLYLNNKIYTIGGSAPETNQVNGAGLTPTNNFWEYDIDTKKWTQLPNVPISLTSLLGFTIRFIYRNNVWIGDERGLYEYDFATKQWASKIKFNNLKFGNCHTVIGDKLYLFSILPQETSKVIDLTNGSSKEFPFLQTEAGTWRISRANFVRDNRIYFWITKMNVSPSEGKMYAYYYDIDKNTYVNVGMPLNLQPQAANNLSPTVAFEKDGIIYFYSLNPGSTYFGSYNPANNVFSSLNFDPNKPLVNNPNWVNVEAISDGKGIIYKVLGDIGSGGVADPKRFDKNVYLMRFQ